MSMCFEQDIVDSQSLLNQKTEELNMLKEAREDAKKKLKITKDPNLIAQFKKCIGELDGFIDERDKILYGHQKCITAARKCFQEMQAFKNPH